MTNIMDSICIVGFIKSTNGRKQKRTRRKWWELVGWLHKTPKNYSADDLYDRFRVTAGSAQSAGVIAQLPVTRIMSETSARLYGQQRFVMDVMRFLISVISMRGGVVRHRRRLSVSVARVDHTTLAPRPPRLSPLQSQRIDCTHLSVFTFSSRCWWLGLMRPPWGPLTTANRRRNRVRSGI